MPFEHYKSQVEKENAGPDAFDRLLAEAKQYMTAASTRIGKLASTDEDCRDTLNYPTEKLSKLQKLIVRNSLVGAKLKMYTMSKPDATLVLSIDKENSVPDCPAFELTIKEENK